MQTEYHVLIDLSNHQIQLDLRAQSMIIELTAWEIYRTKIFMRYAFSIYFSKFSQGGLSNNKDKYLEKKN